MHIRLDPLDGPEIAALLQEHLDEMHLHSPPESIHALDLSRLRAPGISFWSAWDGDELVGCVALKQMDLEHGELKSMRTAARHQGRGIGKRLLEHVLHEARRRGYRRVSLETGSMEGFRRARSLYAKHGFQPCPPFGDYREDPNSVFMTLSL